MQQKWELATVILTLALISTLFVIFRLLIKNVYQKIVKKNWGRKKCPVGLPNIWSKRVSEHTIKIGYKYHIPQHFWNQILVAYFYPSHPFQTIQFVLGDPVPSFYGLPIGAIQ